MKVDWVKIQRISQGPTFEKQNTCNEKIYFASNILYSLSCLQRHVDKSCFLCCLLPGFLSTQSFSGVTVLCESHLCAVSQVSCEISKSFCWISVTKDRMNHKGSRDFNRHLWWSVNGKQTDEKENENMFEYYILVLTIYWSMNFPFKLSVCCFGLF